MLQNKSLNSVIIVVFSLFIIDGICLEVYKIRYPVLQPYPYIFRHYYYSLLYHYHHISNNHFNIIVNQYFLYLSFIFRCLILVLNSKKINNYTKFPVKCYLKSNFLKLLTLNYTNKINSIQKSTLYIV